MNEPYPENATGDLCNTENHTAPLTSKGCKNNYSLCFNNAMLCGLSNAGAKNESTEILNEGTHFTWPKRKTLLEHLLPCK